MVPSSQSVISILVHNSWIHACPQPKGCSSSWIEALIPVEELIFVHCGPEYTDRLPLFLNVFEVCVVVMWSVPG